MNNAKCTLFIGLLPRIRENDANMLGTIFRRIVPEQIFLIDESNSDTTIPAIVEYNSIKKLNDQGKCVSE